MQSSNLSNNLFPEFSESRKKSGSSSQTKKKGSVDTFCFEKGKFHEISAGEVINFSIRELCNSPLVLRFTFSEDNKAYFVAASEPYERLKAEGKKVRWIYDLFNYWRQELILRGFPSDVSIYHWRLVDLSTILDGLIVLKPTRVEVIQ